MKKVYNEFCIKYGTKSLKEKELEILLFIESLTDKEFKKLLIETRLKLTKKFLSDFNIYKLLVYLSRNEVKIDIKTSIRLAIFSNVYLRYIKHKEQKVINEYLKDLIFILCEFNNELNEYYFLKVTTCNSFIKLINII